MKKLLLNLQLIGIILIINTKILNAQTSTIQNKDSINLSEILIAELNQYIDTINSYDKGEKVFIVLIKDYYFYYGKLNCVISYCKDFSAIRRINPSHYFYLNNDLILLRISSIVPKRSIETLKLKKYNELDKKNITSILDPGISITGKYNCLKLIYNKSFSSLIKRWEKCPDGLDCDMLYYDEDYFFNQMDSIEYERTKFNKY